ncbi:MAG: HNH endonuclease domain-containing protein [Spirosomataceae bacterium]
MQLPESEELEISNLSSVFSDTTNSYKFYWFLSILDSLQEKNECIISLDDLALRMIARVWYPLDYFKLSFGKQDGFKPIAEFVTSKFEVNNTINSPSLFSQLNNKLSLEDSVILRKKVVELLRWVPYRFLRPYFSNETKGLPDHQVNGRIIELANLYFHTNPKRVIYKFSGDKIILNPIWANYFQKHQTILKGFIYWHLIKFLQKNNPNVVGLSEKLEKPIQRDLKVANSFWKEYLNENSVVCIYSEQELTLQNWSLDHFLPWSFVVHDQLWNIVPTSKNVNSVKGNWLPSIDHYMDKYINSQFEALKYHVKKENFRLLEDYTNLFSQDSEYLKPLTLEAFGKSIKKHILPQFQTARNMGFGYPFVYVQNNK